jgi:hypothetical protein
LQSPVTSISLPLLLLQAAGGALRLDPGTTTLIKSCSFAGPIPHGINDIANSGCNVWPSRGCADDEVGTPVQVQVQGGDFINDIDQISRWSLAPNYQAAEQVRCGQLLLQEQPVCRRPDCDTAVREVQHPRRMRVNCEVPSAKSLYSHFLRSPLPLSVLSEGGRAGRARGWRRKGQKGIARAQGR